MWWNNIVLEHRLEGENDCKWQIGVLWETLINKANKGKFEDHAEHTVVALHFSSTGPKLQYC